MKTRIAFVANSSSSSFIVGRSNLTEEQIEMIKNHIDVAKKMNIGREYYGYDVGLGDAWEITITEDYVEGDTIQDNFDMHHFLVAIGVPEDKIEMGDF